MAISCHPFGGAECSPNGPTFDGGEDFAYFLEKVPGCLFYLGVRNEDKGIVHFWHHPEFDLDEDALPLGAGVLAQVVIDCLGQV